MAQGLQGLWRPIHSHGLALKSFVIGYVGEEKPGILWIGVVPGTLTDKDGVPLQIAGKVFHCLRESHVVFDIDCELKKSEVDRYAGPTPVSPYRYLNPAVDVQVSFTPTIGTCISPNDRSDNVKTETFFNIQGAPDVYITFPDHPEKVVWRNLSTCHSPFH